MNLPNKLTFIRLVLAVPFIYFLQESNAEGFVYRMIAFALFVVASLTDFFDGYLARKYNLVTDFGRQDTGHICFGTFCRIEIYSSMDVNNSNSKGIPYKWNKNACCC